jgi:hypothetical protein
MTVQADFYEHSSSPTQNVKVGRDTIILDTQIIYPKKISIGDTSAVLSMGGSISFFSLLYYYCLVRKREFSEEEYDSDELTNKETMSSSNSYTLGIASPRGSDSSWGGRSIVSSEEAQDFDEMIHQSSKSIMGSFPIVLDSKFQRTTDVGENTRSKRSVTFSKVDTGWATFDEEVGCDSDLFMIKEEEAETDSCVEIEMTKNMNSGML